MKAPISWLNEYTKIKLSTKDLMWRMTEAGLTTEKYERVNGNVVLDVEVTPNRPDWLSMVGIAREISVIQDTKLNKPNLPEIRKPSKNLPISINIVSGLVGRYSGVTVSGVKVKDSPKQMQTRLRLLGLRPINNLVDITNYVMFELGLPIHVFDYDKFLTNKLSLELSKGGEEFSSVDGISYKLPKGALIIKDKDRVIDLAAIKGGSNTGITNATKNIFIHIPIYDPATTRKTSQIMKLSSDASYIYERGPDLGGTINTLKRTVDLTIKHAGGKIASEIIDIKSKEYKPRKLVLSYEKLINTLGADIPQQKVKNILNRLDLSPVIKRNKMECLIPTYRGDLNIEEDLIEEVARIYRYNKFPKTLPSGTQARKHVPYYYNRGFEMHLKNTMVSAGFTEVNTLALTSLEIIQKSLLNVENHIRIANPVSLEYEFLRTTLIPDLLNALTINQNEKNIKIFEYNKTYFAPVDKANEPYKLSAIMNKGNYRDIKGLLDLIRERINMQEFIGIKPYTFTKGLWHPNKSGVLEIKNDMIGIIGEINPAVLKNLDIKSIPFAFELDVTMLKKYSRDISFTAPNKYPPQLEDITLNLNKNVQIGDLMHSIDKFSNRIVKVQLIDSYDKSFTFRIWYQHPNKTLKDSEVDTIRKKLLVHLKKKFNISQKQ